MDLLRFITAGSVDDGKSTLIGRLLYDSKNILADQLETLRKQSRNKVYTDIDLALITDGLRAEREQGITIDVAYKYFSTPRRKFIIADAPGHIQYTKNMITGASNADCIIILIDAQNGVTEQTRRHSIIAALLNISHVVIAINKMDLVQYDENIYNAIKQEYQRVADELNINPQYIPVSALKGENIIEPSENLSWYEGLPLLSWLETIEVNKSAIAEPSRFTVQYVIRAVEKNGYNYRGYAGKVGSGIYKKGDVVKVLPSGITTRIKKIEINGREVQQGFAGQSIILLLEDDIDIGRGDDIIKIGELPSLQNEFDVLMCWMDTKELIEGNKYLLQRSSKKVRAVVKKIEYKLHAETLSKQYNPDRASLNDVIRATIRTAEPITFDAYKKLPSNGTAILIDETSNITVGACLIQ